MTTDVVYLQAVDKLLAAEAATASVEVLQVLASIFCREPGHVREDAMQASLSVMARRLPGAPVLAAAEWLYRMFCDDAYLMGQRKAAVQLMLLPLLGSASEAVLVDFYAKHAADVTAIVAAPLPLYGWGPRAAGGRAQLGSLWLANQAGNHELRGGGALRCADDAAIRPSWSATFRVAFAPLTCCSWPTHASAPRKVWTRLFVPFLCGLGGPVHQAPHATVALAVATVDGRGGPVNTPASRINRAYVTASGAAADALTGKELTTAAVKAAHGTKGQSLVRSTAAAAHAALVHSRVLASRLSAVPGGMQALWPAGPEHAPLRQEYYCAAFNAVCAIVLRTQSQEKFYSGLLFKENAPVAGQARAGPSACPSTARGPLTYSCAPWVLCPPRGPTDRSGPHRKVSCCGSVLWTPRHCTASRRSWRSALCASASPVR